MNITPARNSTHGPFRKVVEAVDTVEEYPKPGGGRARQRVVYEQLACGHRGDTLYIGDEGWDVPTWQQRMVEDALNGKFLRTKRRCLACRVPVCNVCGEPASEEKGPITNCLPVWGYEEAHRETCLPIWEEERRQEEEEMARVREANLARRRAAGEDPCPECKRDRNKDRNRDGGHVCGG